MVQLPASNCFSLVFVILEFSTDSLGMKKITKALKTVNPNALIGLGVAAAIGTAAGVSTVAKKRTQEVKDSQPSQKLTSALNTTLKVGSGVISGIKDDFNTVVESVKSQTKGSCASECGHCATRSTFSPCCTDGKDCKSAKKEEAVTPEPVKAETVVKDAEKAETKSAAAKKPAARKPAARKTATKPAARAKKDTESKDK